MTRKKRLAANSKKTINGFNLDSSKTTGPVNAETKVNEFE